VFTTQLEGKLRQGVQSSRQCSIVKMIGNNTGRREEFRTQTFLVEDGTQKTVYKQAASEPAAEFLKTIIKREHKAELFMRGVFDVLPGSLETGRIRYRFIPSLSVGQAIGQYLRRGDHRSAEALFDEYVAKLRMLPRSRIIPARFLESIAREKRHRVYECIKLGLIDLMPRNIMITDTGWLAIDNEWTFEFEIPVHFVIFRALRELAMSCQSEIRAATSESNPAAVLLAGGTNVYYVPAAWLRHIQKGPRLMTMLTWELNFQRYVTGQDFPVGRAVLFGRMRTGFENESESSIDTYRQKIARIPGLRKGLRAIERGILYLRR
jgi:hypothetical protein